MLIFGELHPTLNFCVSDSFIYTECFVETYLRRQEDDFWDRVVQCGTVKKRVDPYSHRWGRSNESAQGKARADVWQSRDGLLEPFPRTKTSGSRNLHQLAPDQLTAAKRGKLDLLNSWGIKTVNIRIKWKTPCHTLNLSRNGEIYYC